MEREELLKNIISDLNSDDFPFVVEVKGNRVIGRWKEQAIPEDNNKDKRFRPFFVEYTIRKDGTFYGGEMTVHCDEYKPSLTTETRAVYFVSAAENLKWRKRIDSKEWSKIDHDEQKLFSIIEHYLRDHGFSYRLGVCSHTYLNWNQGFLFRIVGALLLLVGAFLFIGSLDSGVLLFHLFPWFFIIIGAWLLLIGIGKVAFFHLRNDLLIKLALGTIAVSWLMVFGFMLLGK